MLRSRLQARRRGIAAVETAVVTLFFLVPMIIGVWEIGRLVQVQQIVSNGTREGARIAGQGFTFKPDGTQTQVTVTSGTPNLRDYVYQYLYGAGLTNLQPGDVTVAFRFLAPRSDGAAATEPYQGEKGQPFEVTVTIPWDRVRWVNLGIVNPTTVTFTVRWQMLTDDPFTVNTTLPSF